MYKQTQKLTISVFRSLYEQDKLFDFDTPIPQDGFLVNQAAHVYRKRGMDDPRMKRTRVISKQQAIKGQTPDYSYQMILRLNRKVRGKGEFELSSSLPLKNQLDLKSLEILESQPYICLNNHRRPSELPSFHIDKGDVIKLGNLYFEVAQTHLSRKQASMVSKTFQQNNIAPIVESESPVDPINKSCRICLLDSQEENDLISPCNCKGTCQYVHFSCLQIWIQSKVKKQQNRLVSIYSLSKLECELCKKEISNKIIIRNKLNTLIEFEWPTVPFIILERLDINKGSGKTFIVLTPNQHSIKIGRSNEMDLRLIDPFISRLHCSIAFKNNRFELKDQGSKFGSLIQLKRGVVIDKIMCVMVGSKLYKFEQVSIKPLLPI